MSIYLNQNKTVAFTLKYLPSDGDLGAKPALKQLAIISHELPLLNSRSATIPNKSILIYSQDLLNNLFRHPYTKIEFVVAELQVSRPTATAYLEALVGAGMLQKFRLGKSNYYMNTPLFNLLREGAVSGGQVDPVVTKHSEIENKGE
ncbi:hypothetical protein SAMN05444008_10198 [Cnuella takakiae]|uniref:Adenylyltransferase SoFic-like C-terminal domain-containing protein n=1 Tax=Cnuella takakiae TaxID=1302690 RepID=A0A1M4SEH1_9BACT|nr:hypothetical protein [Cnuella takakiae]OLY94482.1 hypothetical protein BUE76_23350 [Cnuella takakiae]SHE30610.1 hypothetical protein SAMN05444008_10198 [Cnuella takakiae]